MLVIIIIIIILAPVVYLWSKSLDKAIETNAWEDHSDDDFLKPLNN